jgi:hypothetical protein
MGWSSVSAASAAHLFVEQAPRRLVMLTQSLTGLHERCSRFGVWAALDLHLQGDDGVEQPAALLVSDRSWPPHHERCPHHERQHDGDDERCPLDEPRPALDEPRPAAMMKKAMVVPLGHAPSRSRL